MTDVISVRFTNRGKKYYFDPKGKTVAAGERVIVETAKGLDIGECTAGNHAVEDGEVVKPLRPLVRLATADDLRISEENKKLEKEAFAVCKEKIISHGLDMKLVGVECGFEGNKILFFFTSDGRVDFRELVKDLAGIFRMRIELRQIGVRDETKMMGGLGICGRPYCCSQFLNDFEPVSTKMAKTQSMSLNPTKISGSCGRLMCCLRYEQEAYEDLLKSIPKNGAFVQTTAGYGNVVQTNVLRQKIKVRLDGEDEHDVRVFDAEQVAQVSGGRPKPGEKPPDVLKYVPVAEEKPVTEDPWRAPSLFADNVPEKPQASGQDWRESENYRSRNHKKGAWQQGERPASKPPQPTPATSGEAQNTPGQGSKKNKNRNHRYRPRKNGADNK